VSADKDGIFSGLPLILRGRRTNLACARQPAHGRKWVKTRRSHHAPATFAVGTRVTSRPPHRSVRAPIRAYGSHLGCLTAKATLWPTDEGFAVFGSQSSANRLIRSQVVQSFWLRCRSVRRQRLVTWNRKRGQCRTVRRHRVVVEVAGDGPAAAIFPAGESADACSVAVPV